LDLCILRDLAAVDGVEHMILVAERVKFVLLAKSPVLSVGVAHSLAVIARVRRRERERVVGSGKLVSSGGVKCLDLS
jgi:hypothetical protein